VCCLLLAACCLLLGTDRAGLGQAACALQLSDTLSCTLGVALPESPGTHELALLKAAPEEWSAPNHSELLAMVAKVWRVGPDTSRHLQQSLQVRLKSPT